MAEAAETQAVWTHTQALLTALEIGALVVVIGYTIKATNAAVAANTIARETAQRELRAYVYVVSVEREPFDATTDIVNIATKNFGQTPAYDVGLRIGLEWGKDESSVDFEAIPAPNAPPSSLAPGAEHFSNRKIATILPNYLGFQKGRLRLYTFGEISYRDAFGQDRITRFRLCNADYLVASFMHCRDGNSAT